MYIYIQPVDLTSHLSISGSRIYVYVCIYIQPG